MKEALKNIWLNYWFPIIASIVGAIVFTYIYDEYDVWYFVGTALLSGCIVSCIIYFLLKLFKK
jgi:uncharacterized membrane protein YeaQ/YmgE (transglycosylase-associated protein family)